MAFDKAMQRALEADGEKLRQLTGADHSPHFVQDDDEFAVIADRGVIAQLPPIVADDSEIFDPVAPKLVSFDDERLGLILRFARGMSSAKRARYLSEIVRRLLAQPTDPDIRLAIALAAAAD
jgi:hypothetical protein